jgi:hypothetical protein
VPGQRCPATMSHDARPLSASSRTSIVEGSETSTADRGIGSPLPKQDAGSSRSVLVSHSLALLLVALPSSELHLPRRCGRRLALRRPILRGGEGVPRPRPRRDCQPRSAGCWARRGSGTVIETPSARAAETPAVEGISDQSGAQATRP